jgi:hypothetical protein
MSSSPSREADLAAPGMRIITRVILQPYGGGEPVEVFDRFEEESVEVDTLLHQYTQAFGSPFDVALTAVPGLDGPVAIGWLFAVPDSFLLPGPTDAFEMVLIPMFDDAGTDERTSIFLRLAETRQAFQGMLERGEIDALTTATLAWGDPAEQARAAQLDTEHRMNTSRSAEQL